METSELCNLPVKTLDIIRKYDITEKFQFDMPVNLFINNFSFETDGISGFLHAKVCQHVGYTDILLILWVN